MGRKRQPSQVVFTAPKKARFLKLLAERGRVAECAREVGTTLSTVERARDPQSAWYDEQFAVGYDEALELYADLLEAAAHRRAVEGVDEPRFTAQGGIAGHVRRYSDSLLAQQLKARREAYREKVDVQQRVWHSSQIQLSDELKTLLGGLSREGRQKLKEVLQEAALVLDTRGAEQQREAEATARAGGDEEPRG